MIVAEHHILGPGTKLTLHESFSDESKWTVTQFGSRVILNAS
jgi:hypothetical protein